jgi:hypothetical protein
MRWGESAEPATPFMNNLLRSLKAKNITVRCTLCYSGVLHCYKDYRCYAPLFAGAAQL